MKIQLSSSIGLFGATFLVFLVMRLAGYTDWAWYWVVSPLLAMPALFVAVAVPILVSAARRMSRGGRP